jgi:hypothetical protein
VGTAVHQIRKQTIEFTFRTREEGTTFRPEMARLCESSLNAEIERVLDRIAPTEGSLLLDRVEIDLGVLSPAELKTHKGAIIATRLGQKLEEALLRSLGLNGAVGTSAAAETANEIPWTDEHSSFSILRQFIESGTLPWWASDARAKSVDLLLLDALNDDGRTVPYLLDAAADGGVRERLVSQFSDKALFTMATRMFGLERVSVADMVESLWESLKGSSGLSRGRARTGFWEALLSTVTEIGPSRLRSFSQDPFQEAFLAHLSRTLPRLSPQHIAGVARTNDHDETNIGSMEKEAQMSGDQLLRPNLPDSFVGRKTDIPRRDARYDSSVIAAVSGANSYTGKRATDACLRGAPALFPTVTKWAGIPTAGGNRVRLLETIDVGNSGLILLAPFLRAFFDTLELSHGGIFVSEQAKVAAIHLLQFIATARPGTHYEHLLPLNKILCGWDVERPLPARVGVTRRMRTEGEELIMSVIKHWSALGKTSVDGFRQSFLQRFGVIEREEGKWVLRVERKGYDVLLERLPWGIGAIKSSWMKEPLFVEW